jgi:hypothetical protein
MPWTRFGWSKSASGVISFAIIAWAIFYFTAGQIGYALQRGENVTEIIDSYSEANGIRAGESYADRGFTSNDGLPDIGYGNSFDNVGGKHDRNLCPSLPCVYLHYPPGPDLVIGAMTKMCGKGNISCLRIAPIFTGFACFVLFAWAAAWSMGIQRTAFVFGTFYFAPMISNGMHNLHYHSYVVSLLFVYAGLLLVAFLRPPKDIRLVLGGLFTVGFLYGWCSFDYAFHIALLPLPFWLMAADWRAVWRKYILATVAAGLGYTLANVIHLVQVRLFLGSWDAVFADFGARAALRLNGHLEASVTLQPAMRLLFIYWTRLLMEPHFLGFSFLGTCAATMALLLPRRDVVLSRRWGVAWAPLRTFKWAFVAAFLIPDLWLLVMREHGSVHGHFLPRNFIVTYVTGAILLALSFKKVEAVTDAGDKEAAAARNEPVSAAA